MTKKKNPEDLLPVGRPTLYKPEYCQQIIDYFNVDAYTVDEDDKGNQRIAVNRFPTLTRFALKIGVYPDTLVNWTHEHPDFLGAYKVAKKLQESVLAEGALAGAYHGSFAIFTAKNVCDWRDKTEVDQTINATVDATVMGKVAIDFSDIVSEVKGGE